MADSESNDPDFAVCAHSRGLKIDCPDCPDYCRDLPNGGSCGGEGVHVRNQTEPAPRPWVVAQDDPEGVFKRGDRVTETQRAGYNIPVVPESNLVTCEHCTSPALPGHTFCLGCAPADFGGVPPAPIHESPQDSNLPVPESNDSVSDPAEDDGLHCIECGKLRPYPDVATCSRACTAAIYRRGLRKSPFPSPAQAQTLEATVATLRAALDSKHEALERVEAERDALRAALTEVAKWIIYDVSHCSFSNCMPGNQCIGCGNLDRAREAIKGATDA